MYIIIGASGFIGRHMYQYCKINGLDVLGTYHQNCNCPELIKFDICVDNLYDISNQFIGKGRPCTLIICGANSSIDGCKKNEYVSNNLNVLGTKKILKQADKLGMKSVFLSSEAVFDGKKGMYTEDDIPNPITLYGKQKRQIEQYILHNLQNYLIFRISRATGCSYGEQDIFHEFYSKIINNEEIVCLKNQSFCLTEVDDIVYGVFCALQQGLCGLYHLSSDNYISRYELAKLYTQKIFGGYDKISERKYEEISFLDNRHIYGGLNGNTLANLLGLHYMDIDEILNQYSSSYMHISQTIR